MKRIDPIGFGSQDTTLEMLDTDNVLAVFQETYPDFHELLTSVLQDMAREVRLGDTSKGDIVLYIVPEKLGVGFNFWFVTGGIETRLERWFNRANFTEIECNQIRKRYMDNKGYFFSYEHPFSLPESLGIRQIVDAILPHFMETWNLRATSYQQLFREGQKQIQRRRKTVDVVDYKAMNFDDLRAQYKSYLTTQGFSRNTISTAYTDTFYLWRKVNSEIFWKVLESNNFEVDAKTELLNALRANSSGNVNSLIGGYMAHLRRFRRFLGWEMETPTTVADQRATGQHGARTVDIPRPSPEQVIYYLRQWDELENYHLQESALDRLFHQLCPENKTIEDILLKAATLNDFYSTNIFSIFPVAKHILELDIDTRLMNGDLTLVDDLQTVMIGGKERHFYSFASKYCSHHNEKDYPIYDSYVDEVLRYFRAKHCFECFANDGLKEYGQFKDILIAFQSYYGLNQFSLKEVDKYIWQLGKDYFPKSY